MFYYMSAHILIPLQCADKSSVVGFKFFASALQSPKEQTSLTLALRVESGNGGESANLSC